MGIHRERDERTASKDACQSSVSIGNDGCVGIDVQENGHRRRVRCFPLEFDQIVSFHLQNCQRRERERERSREERCAVSLTQLIGKDGKTMDDGGRMNSNRSDEIRRCLKDEQSEMTKSMLKSTDTGRISGSEGFRSLSDHLQWSSRTETEGGRERGART